MACQFSLIYINESEGIAQIRVISLDGNLRPRVDVLHPFSWHEFDCFSYSVSLYPFKAELVIIPIFAFKFFLTLSISVDILISFTPGR